MDESHSQELVKHLREIVERLDDMSYYAASSTSQRVHFAAMAMQGLKQQSLRGPHGRHLPCRPRQLVGASRLARQMP